MVKVFAINREPGYSWLDSHYATVVIDFLNYQGNAKLTSWNIGTKKPPKEPTVIARWHDGILIMKDPSKCRGHWLALWALQRRISITGVTPVIYKTTKHLGGTQVEMAKFLAAFQ